MPRTFSADFLVLACSYSSVGTIKAEPDFKNQYETFRSHVIDSRVESLIHRTFEDEIEALIALTKDLIEAVKGNRSPQEIGAKDYSKILRGKIAQ